jgi:hypothetical protein
MKLLAFSGKKSSGKTTTANWIIGQQMCAIQMVSWIRINAKGQLIIPAVVDGELINGIFDPMSPDPDVQKMLAQYIWPSVKLYSFANTLKLSVMAIFGLSYDQVNGTNDQKNQLTQYKWGQFWPFLNKSTKKMVISKYDNTYQAQSSYMSGREILQVFGTDIGRRINENVWGDACLREVQNDQPKLAIVTDCRFPSEVQAIQEAGGKVIRFLRAPFADQDEHSSEQALDNYPLENFDYVFDNRELSVEEQNKLTNELLTEWGYNTWDWEATS